MTKFSRQFVSVGLTAVLMSFPIISFGDSNCTSFEYLELKDMSKAKLLDDYCFNFKMGKIHADGATRFSDLGRTSRDLNFFKRSSELSKSAQECFKQAGSIGRVLSSKYNVDNPQCIGATPEEE